MEERVNNTHVLFVLGKVLSLTEFSNAESTAHLSKDFLILSKSCNCWQQLGSKPLIGFADDSKARSSTPRFKADLTEKLFNIGLLDSTLSCSNCEEAL
jgi:hypothetical protein